MASKTLYLLAAKRAHVLEVEHWIRRWNSKSTRVNIGFLLLSLRAFSLEQGFLFTCDLVHTFVKGVVSLPLK